MSEDVRVTKPMLGAVGIDVSKATLDVAFVYETTQTSERYRNDDTGIALLLAKLQAATGQYKVVMESTGRYHLLGALRLSEAAVDVRVINPLLAKPYYGGQIRKVKTDKADARVLARMALLEPKLPATFRNDKIAIQIRQKMGLLASLEKQRQALSAMFNDYRSFQKQLGIEASDAEQQLLKTLKLFNRQIARLEQELEQLVVTQTHQATTTKRLQSIPGVSAFVASLLAQFMDANAQHPKQWLAFIGLDISVRESGQWRGKAKVTKRGNAYLRKRLYCSAWGAMMHDSGFRSYYLTLKQQGKKHVEALLTIARKLLRIAFTLVTKNTSYDPKCAFPS
ncbi:MAG: IS110 family transposase [Trueperaceae bacterium]